MGTAERYGAPGTGVATTAEVEREPRAPARDSPADIPADISTMEIPARTERGTAVEAEGVTAKAEPGAKAAATPSPDSGRQFAAEAEQREYYRPLWVEVPTTRRRLPDPVRTSAVRAVIIIAVTLIQAMVAFLCTLAGSWLAFPMVLSSVASTVVATWGALDVWVTRQVWNQRHGVVSEPSSTARALRRERRKARRQERTAERAKERIRRRGGSPGQLSHS
ncbi:hypothetical protein O1Q96_15035 [Streptomyces sp. Qhu-G9]|uniref:hypothetical protein n=1 Tax=Streptomyces sp. Qhu-G9 TaxID=3452799 RepID=UPI0022AC8FCB|nr:hypothetical protein [Streptomyces aurantiacus]WAU80972.1 hypothetical protein O1Q96_15035 [Streptomyces aurantiacus]